MPHRSKSLFAGGLLPALIIGCQVGCGSAATSNPRTRPYAAEQTLLVFAAASTAEPVEEIVREFERSHSKVKVRTSFGASSKLAQQIDSGAEADLFLSASEEWARYLADKELAGETQPLVSNRLVLIVPADSNMALTDARGLTDGRVQKLALADPGGVPAGKYAKQALTKLGLWDQVQAKVVGAGDVRQAVAFVETGAAEAGIVYATDAAVSDQVEIVAELPADLTTEAIVYPLVLLNAGADKPAARTLFEEFQSAAAREVFERRGFTALHGEDSGGE